MKAQTLLLPWRCVDANCIYCADTMDHKVETLFHSSATCHGKCSGEEAPEPTPCLLYQRPEGLSSQMTEVISKLHHVSGVEVSNFTALK